MELAPIPDFLRETKAFLLRSEWKVFPDVIIHADESPVKRHPMYEAAKAGDADAAESLVLEMSPIGALDRISEVLSGKTPHLLAVHALETSGMNAIPQVFAKILSRMLDLPVATGIIQINRVTHTGASGYRRLAFPALFGGEVREEIYFLVDDFIGQGGTLANLKGFVESQGSHVVGATVLTGKGYSAKLKLEEETLKALRTKHGTDLEQWWNDAFGYGFERLTESEARYLTRADDAYAISERIVAARAERD